jgi:ribonuclease P protein component
VRRSPFRKHRHLRKPAEFARVYAQRCVARDRYLTLFAAANGRKYSRLGLSVSKRHGSAVIRNRIKRLFREAFRLGTHELPTGLDLVLIPEGARDAKLVELQASLLRATQKLAQRIKDQNEKQQSARVSTQPHDEPAEPHRQARSG